MPIYIIIMLILGFIFLLFSMLHPKGTGTGIFMSICIILITCWILHNEQTHVIDPHEYQVEITDDNTYIYSNNKLLKVIPFDSTQTIDKFFLKDNE